MTDCDKSDCGCKGKKVESTLEVKATASLHEQIIGDMSMEDAPLRELIDKQESEDAREEEA
tara:strand:- start:186 stop:368 length:183 start_codon:yes stop_codon:yes gene_type:complete